jgi:hypothetical protein
MDVRSSESDVFERARPFVIMPVRRLQQKRSVLAFLSTTPSAHEGVNGVRPRSAQGATCCLHPVFLQNGWTASAHFFREWGRSRSAFTSALIQYAAITSALAVS